MPAVTSFAGLADPQTSPSWSSSAPPLKASSAAWPAGNGPASPDASLPRFQDALQNATRPPQDPPPSGTPVGPSPDQASAQAPDDVSAQDLPPQGHSAPARPAKDARTDAAKGIGPQTDAADSQTPVVQDNANPSASAAPLSVVEAQLVPNVPLTGPAHRHRAPTSDSQPVTGTPPNPGPATPADAAATVSVQIAAAQSLPSQPVAAPAAAPIATPIAAPIAAPAAVPIDSSRAALSLDNEQASAPPRPTVKRLPAAQKPASPAGQKPEAEKPAPPSKPQPNPTPPGFDQNGPPTDDPQNPATSAVPAAPFQPVGKPSAKTGADNDAAPQNPSAQPQDPGQIAAAASTGAASTPSDAIAAALQSNAVPDRDLPKPAQASAPIDASPFGHAVLIATPTPQGADAAAAAQQLPATDHDQTFDQIVMGLRGKLDPQNGKAEISLNPPNLGTLHVSISLDRGALTAQFQSSSDLVRDLLKTHMEKLKSVLEGQGIAVDRLAVEAPADKVVPAAGRMPPPNAPQNDGRSAGQYTRDQHSGQKRPQTGGFTPPSRAAAARAALTDAPFDVVA